MPTLGCRNPKAVNYNPAADVDDYSCIYLEKIGEECYAFKDVEEDLLKDESFTLSFSFDGQSWVFFHDYIPDFYFSTKTDLYNLKGSQIFKHNVGAPGLFHNRETPSSFFIDAVFAAEGEMILNAVNWLTEVFNSEQEIEFSTLTHITIWNNQQCTGRIELTQIFEQLGYEVRKTQGLWNFDSFRDMVKTHGVKFLLNIFKNFAVDTDNIDLEKPWFDKDLLHDNFFIIRLEFDNTNGKQLILHGADIDASKSYR